MARIIVIDDDEALREVLAKALTDAGHNVAAAANGFDGVKLFREQPADLIVTDLMMPYGGLPTIRVLRSEFPKLSIIAMSGGGQSHLDIAGGLGANRTLAKPFTAKEFMDAISEVLASAN